MYRSAQHPDQRAANVDIIILTDVDIIILTNVE